MVGIIFLGLMVCDDAHIGDSAVFGDTPDFVRGEKKIVLVPTVVPTCWGLYASHDYK